MTSGGVTETATVNVTVTAVNDAPVNTVPGTQTDQRGRDAHLHRRQRHLDQRRRRRRRRPRRHPHDRRRRADRRRGIAGLTVGGDGTTTHDDPAPARRPTSTTALERPDLRAAGHYNGSRTLTITTNDNGNTGSPGALQDVDTVTINITAQNDTPVVAVAAR